MREFTGRISVLALKVNIRPVNLKSIVNEHVSVKLLNSSNLNNLEPVIKHKLIPLNTIDNSDVSDNDSLIDQEFNWYILLYIRMFLMKVTIVIILFKF